MTPLSLKDYLTEEALEAHELDIEVGNEEVSLYWFESHKNLERLALKMNQTAVTGLGFRCDYMPSLCSLTIHNARIDDYAMFSIIGMHQLQELSLEGSVVDSEWTIRALKNCKAVTSLNLRGVTLPTKDNYVHGAVHHLRTKLPAAKIEADHQLVDHTAYSSVLCPHPIQDRYICKASDSSFCVNGLLKIGDDYNKNWARKGLSGNVYAHNDCNLPYASPIKCMDTRIRIAACGPEDAKETNTLWEFVAEKKITVIAEVRTTLSKYCPMMPGTSKMYGNVKVECVRTAKPNDYTRITELLVNKTTVYHMQLDWKPNEGIDVDKLYPFMQSVKFMERDNPGQTIVHCKAGIGRTGTFFACLILDQLFDQLMEQPQELYLDLQLLLKALRSQRRGMIEEDSQLLTVIYYFKKLLTERTKSQIPLDTPLAALTLNDNQTL